jgi:Na+/proline symporter
MTMAEWMEYRFGSGRQGQAARILAAIANLAFAIATVTYFAQGGGIFLGEILGMNADLAAVLMIAIASTYTIASGLYGVVYTDVFQGFLIFGAIMYVIYLVLGSYALPPEFAVSVPMGDGTFQQIETTREAWTDVVPDWRKEIPGKYGQYSLFGLGILVYLFRSCIDGMSGTGGYIIQRFYAAKDEREAGLLSMFWIVLMSLRWPFVACIAIMGVNYGVTNEVIANPEKVLPVVILEQIPVGLKGLLVAGLIAAAMSTFDSVVNAGAAYWTRDIYQRFLNPDADERTLVWHSRLSSAAVVVIGMISTYAFTTLNDVWSWLTLSLGAGLLIPQVIRWYWWRFNGYGYAGGVSVGMALAVIQKIVAPELGEMWQFLAVGTGTFIASIAITYATAPTSRNVLRTFYEETRPFGFWDPVRERLDTIDLDAIRAENRRDILAICLAVPWQLTLFLTTMMVVTRRWMTVAALAGILAVLTVGLYFAWYRHLSVSEETAAPAAATADLSER